MVVELRLPKIGSLDPAEQKQGHDGQGAEDDRRHVIARADDQLRLATTQKVEAWAVVRPATVPPRLEDGARAEEAHAGDDSGRHADERVRVPAFAFDEEASPGVIIAEATQTRIFRPKAEAGFLAGLCVPRPMRPPRAMARTSLSRTWSISISFRLLCPPLTSAAEGCQTCGL